MAWNFLDDPASAFSYISHGKLQAMIRYQATCSTSSTLSRKTKDFASTLNKLRTFSWVPLCHSLNSFFFLVFLYGAVSGARGLYLAQVLYTNTRPYVTIRNASNRFLRYAFSTFLNDGFTRIPLPIFEIRKNVCHLRWSSVKVPARNTLDFQQ